MQARCPTIFADINTNIRSKYELIYHPLNPKQDGTYRKLRVELVDEEGKPLRFQDEKHKPLKYDIIARDGYRARPEVEWRARAAIDRASAGGSKLRTIAIHRKGLVNGTGFNPGRVRASART